MHQHAPPTTSRAGHQVIIFWWIVPSMDEIKEFYDKYVVFDFWKVVKET